MILITYKCCEKISKTFQEKLKHVLLKTFFKITNKKFLQLWLRRYEISE